MELREFAEQILFAETLEEKLRSPGLITDEQPGTPVPAPEMPGRPFELRFKTGHTGKSGMPAAFSLERTDQRGRLLHFFANHELLATELMALVLLRFPAAPPGFRRGILQTLKDEQEHTRLYLARMKACGIAFGELPVSGYFWRAISGMESPLDYLARLSLTFEQANLDFTRLFSHGFAQVGDTETSRLLDRIYRDEIGHVAYGLKWFRKWKDPHQSDWEAFCRLLKFPMSPQRAKGPLFNIEGRLAAGLDRRFIDELNVYARSKGRTPAIFVFNPFAEGRIARGKSFTPNKHQQQMREDLENLPQFLCRQDDVVLVKHRPSAGFLSVLKTTGFDVPEFVELPSGRIEKTNDLCLRKLGKLSPWAWGPDSLEILEPLVPHLTGGSGNLHDFYNERLEKLYSKEWGAGLLGKLLETAPTEDPPWICTRNELCQVARTFEETVAAIETIRRVGHLKIVIKESIGLAGHNAIRILEPVLLENQKRWILNVLEGGGNLVIEPWLEREFDFSVQLEMQSSGLKVLGYTGLLCDSKGQFRGNWAEPGFRSRPPRGLNELFPGLPDISHRVQDLYSNLISILEREFKDLGFLGPAGIDAFVYRTSHGECRLKPLVELNPRYTMGRLTLELMKNVAPGRTGIFQILNRAAIKRDGFDDFSSWSQASSLKNQLKLEGEPVPRIAEGVVCLNDPQQAQVCLAIFQVTSRARVLDSGRANRGTDEFHVVPNS
jgi:uncharacterized ferritin-like protein (DUF455 family)